MYENEMIEFNDNNFNHYINHFGDYELEYMETYLELENIELYSDSSEEV